MADNFDNFNKDEQKMDETENKVEILDDEDKIMKSEDESNSDSSDDDDANDMALELIVQLQEKIKTSPYMYDNHTELIKHLKTVGELEKLREAREYMSTLFPLAPELWLDWLQDEIKLIETSEDRQKITSLFLRAVQDYQSVPLWLEYVQFAIGGMQEEGGITKIRQTFEEAITAVGLHVKQGSMIWDAYRETENAILAGLLIPPGAVPTAEQEDAFNVQNKRVSSLFKRQLAVPLLDMEQTYSEYKEWLCDEVDENTEKVYQKTIDILLKLKPLEEALSVGQSPYWDEYQTYIQHEVKDDDPSRIQCIFERTITDNCLNTEIWLQYSKYLDCKLKIKPVVLPVYERAVRNCPWSCQLWKQYILALERHKENGDKIKATVTKALSSGFTMASEYCTIWSTYLDYFRRQINWSEDHEQELSLFRETVENALVNLQEYFGNEGNETWLIKQYWALIEGKHCQNMTKARELWDEIIYSACGNQANFWLEYYKFERAYGDNKHCRSMLKNALHKVIDYPESIVEAYINFEREEGTLEDYDIAVAKCEVRLEKLKDIKIKVEEKELVVNEKKKDNKSKKFDKNKKFKKEVTSPGPKQTKTHSNNRTSPNKRKFEEPSNGDSNSNKAGFKVPPPPGYKGEPPSKKPKIVETEGVIHDPSKDNRTVFVSNLTYNIKEQQLKDIFCKCGEITEIRLVKNITGKSKGYCYVEFIDELPVQKALQLDRQLINTRPMYVSKCEDRGGGAKKPDFKYSLAIEKNKLFVKNLPFTCTKEALSTIFKQHGKLKDVRLITFRSGQPKGLAYVEYETEEDAAHAVLKTDGLQIGEFTIEVAISNPPARKAPLNKRDEFIPSLGSGKKESEVRGKARTQIALLPRSVQKGPAKRDAKPSAPSLLKTSAETSSNSEGGGDAGTPTTANLSNADFRTMLLKK